MKYRNKRIKVGQFVYPKKFDAIPWVMSGIIWAGALFSVIIYLAGR